jgi:transcriptional regulator with XRE-family HTH domain
VIALGIVSHKHGISGAELRFLRTEMGLSQAELAKFIHRDGQSVGRWERGEVEIDETAETVIRLLANELLELNAGTTVAETARRAGATVIRNPIKIAANKGSGEPYRLIAA